MSIYCESLDTGNLDALEEILDGEAVLEVPPDLTVSGREAIVKWFADAIGEQVAFRRHFNTNAQVELLSAGNAEIRTYFLSLLGRDGDLMVAWGNFVFGVSAIDDRTRVTRIRLEIEMPPSSLREFLL